MANELAALSNELAAAVEQAGRAVVAVHARPRFSSSGVFWRPGVIVTAEHTIRREEEITVTLPDGVNAPATLAGSDPGTDIAVLKVECQRLHPSPRDPLPGSRQPGAHHRALGGFRRQRHHGDRQRRQRLLADLARRTARPLHPARPHAVSRLVRSAVVNVAGEVIGIATSALSRIAGRGDSRLHHRSRGGRNPDARPRLARLPGRGPATGGIARSSQRSDRVVARARRSGGEGRRAHRRHPHFAWRQGGRGHRRHSGRARSLTRWARESRQRCCAAASRGRSRSR